MRSRVLASLAGAGCGLAVTCTVALLADADARPDDDGQSVGPAMVVGAGLASGRDPLDDPREVLRRWDADRAAAWTSGDTAGLGALYTPASVAGRRDVAMLRAWNARGQRVTEMTTQVLALRVQIDEEQRLVLRVTDRLVGVEARAGPLPRDEVSTRTVELRRADHGAWRMASVSEQARW